MRGAAKPHISGYILEDGQVHGITASSGTQEYRRAVPVGGIVEVTAVRGKTFALTSSTVNSGYWAPYSSNTYLQPPMRVACEGRIGSGVQQLGMSRT